MFRLSRVVVPFLFLLGNAVIQAFAAEVTITTNPVIIAQVGQPYEYDVDAISSDSGDVILYSLREMPAGMSISDSTGLIRWNPVQVGSFQVKIRAQGNSSGSGSGHDDQEYAVRVLSGRPSSLLGVVRSADGQPVAHVRLRLFETTTGRFLFNERSDSAGVFNFMSINPGSYFLRAMPKGSSPFLPQWYDRAQRIQDATPIVVPDSSVVTIVVTLLMRDTVQFYLSGTVRDTAGNPIAAARVSVFRDRRHDDLDPSGVNFRGLDDDDRDRELVRRVVTDSAGNYQVRLRPHTYIVASTKQGFRSQFWNHKESPLDADRIDLRSDTSGINFDLARIPSTEGSLTGTITSETTMMPVQAHVLGLHRSTPHGRFTGFIRHAHTDSTGAYRLSGLRGGFYIVLALPEGQFLPTFYDTSGGTTDIRRAFPVEVANTPADGINIRVLPDTVTGLNRVRGNVSGGAVPLAGVLMYASSTQTDEVIGAAISSTDGRYAIVGMEPGSYRLLATKPGYETSSVPFTLQHGGALPSTVDINLNLDESSTSVDDRTGGQPASFVLDQNYPNPFNPSTSISFSIPLDGNVRLAVYNILGQRIATLLDEVLPVGVHSVRWDGGAVASGVYFYKLEFNGLVKIGRMVLLR